MVNNILQLSCNLTMLQQRTGKMKPILQRKPWATAIVNSSGQDDQKMQLTPIVKHKINSLAVA